MNTPQLIAEACAALKIHRDALADIKRSHGKAYLKEFRKVIAEANDKQRERVKKSLALTINRSSELTSQLCYLYGELGFRDEDGKFPCDTSD